MANYTFLASNVLTNQVIDELPLTKVKYSRALNNHGIMTGQISLDDTGVNLRALVSNGAVEPGAVAVYVVRDSSLVWGGILWNHQWDSSSGILTINGAEFDSYLAFRYLMQDATYTNDSAVLAANWISAAFADGGPPLTTLVTNSGYTDTVQINHWEQHNILDLVKVYAVLPFGQGLDYEFDIVPDGNGNPSARLTVSAPRRGVGYVNTGIVWDYPGPVMKYKLTRAADQGYTNDLVVTGAGSGTAQFVAEAQRTAAPYVKMTAIQNNRDLTSQAAVNNQATGQLLSLGVVPNMYQATIYANDFFAAGITVGDEFIMSVSDGYQHANVPQRLIGYEVTVNDESSSEVVAMALGAPL